MKPDGIMQGMIRALAWEKNQDPGNEMLFTFPETTLEAFALSIRDRLQFPGLRVVGDPAMKLRRVAFLPGAAGVESQIKALEMDGVDVLVAGEAREWETVEYARDASAEHRHKALILMGHVPSEEEGMRFCAAWLHGFLPRIPVSYLPAGTPFARLKR
jgi:putative NIF3 family GTP cyclohydrolase 1 type 2